MNDIAKITAKILLDTKSVLFNADEPFTYTSGRRGPVYVDCRRLISFPDERKILMDAAAIKIKEICPDAACIAGGETAGIPYAAFIAERLHLPMIYVRKKPKGFGKMSQIEGEFAEGEKIVLTEDVQNFGTSIKIFIPVLRAAGAVADDALVLFQHGHADVKKEMAEMGVRVHALADWWAVLAVAKEESHFDAKTLSSVESYLRDPDAWNAALPFAVKGNA